MIKNIKGAIFDLDGTLLDSMKMWRSVSNIYLESIGITPRDDLPEYLELKSLTEACEYIKEVYAVPYTCEEIISQMFRNINNFYENEALLKEGAKEYLKKLKSEGVKITLATATDKPLMISSLKRHGIYNLFDAIFTCDELSTKKAEPKIYETALSYMGTPKESTYVFEDILIALQTAKAAGFKTCGVYDEMAEGYMEEIKKASDIFINSFAELL